MTEKMDWSDKQWKKLIIEQRKGMWRPDTVEKFSKWLNLRNGLKVADIGCGLGYLGFTFWEYFGKGGKYNGIDISEDLIKDASKLSEKWAINGEVNFKVSDAYSLDFENNLFDIVMCQTLLMHLENPDKAISEMKRILKPGGIILCIEPDNLSHSIFDSFGSSLEETIEEQLTKHKTMYYAFKGRKKLKLGDNTIGNRLPKLLFNANFTDIDIRRNDKVDFKIPPYDESFLNNVNTSLEQKDENKRNEKFWIDMLQRDVLAGGGTEELLKEYFIMLQKVKSRNRETIIEQLKTEEFYSISPSSLFAVKGTKIND